MMESELKESLRSWRPRRWLRIDEGRKARVSNKAVKVVIWVIGLGILAFQGSALYKPQLSRRRDQVFLSPAVTPTATSTYVPMILNRAEELFDEKRKAHEISLAKRGRPVSIERIRAVNLSSFAGVPPGSETLVTLISGGTNGMVKAVLTEPLKSDGEVVLPARTVLLGNGSSSEERLYMEFTKAILPDRSSLLIKALAYDKEDRILGARGKKISDYAFKLAASSGLIFLGGIADGLREEVNLSVGERRRPSIRDSALTGVTSATSEVGKDMLEKMKSSDARIEVPHSTTVLIIFDEVRRR